MNGFGVSMYALSGLWFILSSRLIYKVKEKEPPPYHEAIEIFWHWSAQALLMLYSLSLVFK